MTANEPVARTAGRQRFLRFLVVGALNTAFGFLVYAAAIMAGVPVWAALLSANVTGVVFNFRTTGIYVFRNRMLSLFPRFVAAYSLVYVVNLALIQLALRWVDDKVIAQAMLTLPMAVFSYALFNGLVFRAPTNAVSK